MYSFSFFLLSLLYFVHGSSSAQESNATVEREDQLSEPTRFLGKNYRCHNDKCYFVNFREQDWESSFKECQNLGGQLAMPKDQSIMWILQQLVKDVPASTPKQSAFLIGIQLREGRTPGVQSFSTDSWKFIDGSVAPYFFGPTFWHNHWVTQPDNYQNQGQRCGYYIATKYPKHNGLLPGNGVFGDENCNGHLFRSICEKWNKRSLKSLRGVK
eukprot:TRINITY_DN30681_c0_g1_i1.p1 TRINITY_DN30681_c0_g1~~TRINITY_DN30681_c0_g1_i1.p1  ORF type:complete len:213 (-),score=15.62 TRINITY_DN30681_c0_g1_i1:248-886(-)